VFGTRGQVLHAAGLSGAGVISCMPLAIGDEHGRARAQGYLVCDIAVTVTRTSLGGAEAEGGLGARRSLIWTHEWAGVQGRDSDA